MIAPVVFRDMQPTDHPFIYNSWLKSYRNSKEGKLYSNEEYYPRFKASISAILDWATVVIACDPEDSWHVYGYAAASVVNGQPILHYVYVKKSFRKLGIGAALLKTVVAPLRKPTEATHLTNAGRKFLKLKKVS